jgi:adenylate cyclase
MPPLQQSLCVLFADVSGDSRLYARLGSAEALHAVERCMTRMERAVAVHGGRVVKVIGDELMAVFESADSTLQASCEMEQRIDDLPPVSGVKLSVRIGFHLGTVLRENNDVLGDAVNVAERVVGLSKASQIVTTADTVSALSLPMRQATRKIDDLSVESSSGNIGVFEVEWRDSAELSLRASHFMPPGVHAHLRLRHANVDVDIDDSREALSFGRDADSDLIVADRRASRNHARIERRSERYVLVDQSTNGTYVTFDGELEFALKHEEVPLRGHGRIAFGHSCRDSNAEIVEFFVTE